MEVSAQAIRQILADRSAELVLSERVMLFRPQGLAMVEPVSDLEARPALAEASALKDIPSVPPVLASLDGLPVENHPLLGGRVIVDDPLAWSSAYPAEDRVHGTAMASLIALGELDGSRQGLSRPIYVRPIMRPDVASSDRPRPECTPNVRLLVDLIHARLALTLHGAKLKCRILPRFAPAPWRNDGNSRGDDHDDHA